VWVGEATDFTPWLAQEENLTLLGDTIGLVLDLEATEKNVGPFRADILCRDTASGSWVLIENQLERTDHSHLGQLITYAAGLKAVTIVWVAAHITEEHRAALDWLNEVTTDSVNFFGLEIEVWQIGNSQRAPKFNVVSKPNNWSEFIRTGTNQLAGNSVSEQLYRAYWAAFMDYAEQQNAGFKRRTPQPQYWMDFGLGRSTFTLQTVVSIQKKYLSVQLVIWPPDAKVHFQMLLRDKETTEREIGSDVQWIEAPQLKSSYVTIYNRGPDPLDQADWRNQHQWLLTHLESFRRCFAPRVKALRIQEADLTGNGQEAEQ
jgi:hypothetical protein